MQSIKDYNDNNNNKNKFNNIKYVNKFKIYNNKKNILFIIMILFMNIKFVNN